MSSKKDIEREGSVTIAVVAVLAVVLGAVYYFLIFNTEPTKDTPTPPAEVAIVEDPAKVYVERMEKQSIATTTIYIGGCTPYPAITKFTLGASIRFINNDEAPHIISFDPQHSFVVPAQGARTQKMNFWKTPGVRHYNCDGAEKAGSVYVSI